MINHKQLAKRIAFGILVFQTVATLAWLGLVYPSVTSWRESIAWLVFMSVWANFAAHLAGLVAAIINYLSEKREDPDDDFS